MPDPGLLLFLAERPQDDVLWHLLAQQYAEADQFEVAAFLRRDYDMIRRCLTMELPDILMIRNLAKEASPEALRLIDTLTPLLRRDMVRRVRAQGEPPPVPKAR
jgi:hypothetical protein